MSKRNFIDSLEMKVRRRGPNKSITTNPKKVCKMVDSVDRCCKNYVNKGDYEII